jgi:hypothetical protein
MKITSTITVFFAVNETSYLEVRKKDKLQKLNSNLLAKARQTFDSSDPKLRGLLKKYSLQSLEKKISSEKSKTKK